MKKSHCLECGNPFVQYGNEDVCPSCDGAVDEHDERVSRELADPAVKARIEAGLREKDAGKEPNAS